MSDEMWPPEHEWENRKYRLQERRGPLSNAPWKIIAIASLIFVVILMGFVTFL